MAQDLLDRSGHLPDLGSTEPVAQHQRGATVVAQETGKSQGKLCQIWEGDEAEPGSWGEQPHDEPSGGDIVVVVYLGGVGDDARGNGLSSLDKLPTAPRVCFLVFSPLQYLKLCCGFV